MFGPLLHLGPLVVCRAREGKGVKAVFSNVSGVIANTVSSAIRQTPDLVNP